MFFPTFLTGVVLLLVATVTSECSQRVGLGIAQRLENGPEVTLGDFSLNKKARLTFVAKVLSVRDYQDMPESQIAPVDIVISWSEDIYPGVNVTQDKRWYYASPRSKIGADFFFNTANLHMVGIDGENRKKLKKGAVIYSSGWLVDVSGPGGFSWRTSLTRLDRGDGACELFFPEKIQVMEEYAEQ